MTAPELPPRDAHLRQALRHAPDAQLEPPAALSERILREARRAVAPLPLPWRLWRALQAALTRPAGAAALASVLLAGVITTLWRDGPPSVPPPEDRAARPAAAPPPAAPAPAVPPAAEAPAADAAPEALARAQRARPAAAAEAAKRHAAEDARESRAAAPPPPDPLADALDTLRAEGADDALAPWLQWQAQAHGRWQPAPGAADAVRDAAGTELRSPGGRALGRLWISPDGVTWQRAGDAARWHVTLPPAALDTLRRQFLR